MTPVSNPIYLTWGLYEKVVNACSGLEDERLLTYMSIQPSIQSAVDRGALREFMPAYLDADFCVHRRVFMSEEAYWQCPPSGPSTKRDLRGCLGFMRMTLEAFIGGDLIHEGQELKRLDWPADEVWEIRSTERPQARLFGWFPAPNVIVITHCERRDNLGHDRHDPRWEATIGKVYDKRLGVLADVPIMKEWGFCKYITRNGIPLR